MALVAVALLASACSSRQEKADQLATTAASLLDAGRFDEARVAILKANAEMDDVPAQYQLQARIELALRHHSDAFQAYSRLLELDPSNQEALQFLAEYYLQLGMTTEAAQTADRSLVLDPQATRSLLVKGLLSLQRRRTEEALGLADQILRINPSDEGGLILKARSLAISGDYTGARKLLAAQSAAGGPTIGMAMTMMAIDRASGNLRGLLQDFDALLPQMPDNVDIRIDFANTLYKAGETALARKELLALIDTRSDRPELLDQIVSLWREYDPTPLAPEELARIATGGKDSVRLAVARFMLETGRAAETEAMLAHAADQQSSEVQGLLARALDAQGRKADARRIVDTVLASDTGNADALLLRSGYALQSNDFLKAVSDAQIVVRDNPELSEGYIALAEAFYRKKEAWRSRQIFETAIHTLPQDSYLLTKYVQFLNRLGDKGRAMTAARDFTNANPASIRGWDILATACIGLGDRNCLADAKQGRLAAQKNYAIDVRPGARQSGNLLGRL